MVPLRLAQSRFRVASSSYDHPETVYADGTGIMVGELLDLQIDGDAWSGLAHDMNANGRGAATMLQDRCAQFGPALGRCSCPCMMGRRSVWLLDRRPGDMPKTTRPTDDGRRHKAIQTRRERADAVRI
jgi:hypothetical protein